MKNEGVMQYQVMAFWYNLILRTVVRWYLRNAMYVFSLHPALKLNLRGNWFSTFLRIVFSPVSNVITNSYSCSYIIYKYMNIFNLCITFFCVHRQVYCTILQEIKFHYHESWRSAHFCTSGLRILEIIQCIASRSPRVQRWAKILRESSLRSSKMPIMCFTDCKNNRLPSELVLTLRSDLQQ